MTTAMGSRIRLHVVRDNFELAVDLALPATGITVLFGASGSGKTTVMRCVAGLERARQGLPPLQPSEYAPAINVGLSPQTRNLLIYGGIALVAVLLLRRRG